MAQDNTAGKNTINGVHEFHEYEGSRWPTTLLYLGSAFLVALIVVFGGRWVYRSVSNSNKDSSSANKTASTGKESAKGAVIVPASPGNGSVTTPKTTPPPTPAPTNMPATGDQLPNTGG